MTDRNQTAFSGAFCPEGVAADLLLKLAVKKIAKCDAGKGIFVILRRKSGIPVSKFHTDMRRRSKGISLHMVNGQNISVKLVSTTKRFVCRIAFSVNRMKQRLKLTDDCMFFSS